MADQEMGINIVKSFQDDKISSPEEFMVVKKCIRHRSSLYHYDKVEDVVYVYPEFRYELTSVPEEVISRLIQNDFDTKIVVDDENE